MVIPDPPAGQRPPGSASRPMMARRWGQISPLRRAGGRFGAKKCLRIAQRVPRKPTLGLSLRLWLQKNLKLSSITLRGPFSADDGGLSSLSGLLLR